jgi:hypothetical protein
MPVIIITDDLTPKAEKPKAKPKPVETKTDKQEEKS